MTPQENWLEVGTFRWFYRDAKPISTPEAQTVVLLHGLPSQSYSWKTTLSALADQGFWAIAPDWLGSGFSDKPDHRTFTYTPDAYIQALADFIQAIGISSYHLVVQGFLGSVGLQYALRYPEQIQRLVILNAPVSTAAKVPWRIRQLGLPLMGEMLTQDPLLVDRTLEGGAKYRIDDRDLDVYRRPFLKSSEAGRSLLATVRNLQLPTAMAELEAGFPQWQKPTLVVWGVDDPWLPVSLAETLVASLPQAHLVKLEQVGHYPQQDWDEKVQNAILPFLRRRVD